LRYTPKPYLLLQDSILGIGGKLEEKERSRNEKFGNVQNSRVGAQVPTGKEKYAEIDTDAATMLNFFLAFVKFLDGARLKI